MTDSTDWHSLIKAKRDDRNSRIPAAWRLPESITSHVNHESNISAFDLFNQTTILTEKEHEITEKYDASTLVKMMATGAISSLEVTTSFCKRAALAQQLTNCLTEIFFDKALQRARECDEFLAKYGRPIGPLHGLPISLKDMLMVKGEAATLGFVAYLKKPVAESNSILVDMLLESGAVLYCKTNVPQTLFMCEGMNNVFGYTMNPHKLSLTPAGSSSGEGALVGFRGSIMGVGSDIGGSIRAPSLTCGAFGFKPSADRIPWGGQQALIPRGWPGVIATLGPHTQSAEDLTLFFRSVLRGKPWERDSSALAIPWREVPRKDKLTIGFWLEDPAVPVYPPVVRALKAAVAKLEAAGHEVKVISAFPSLLEGAKIFGNSMELDTEHAVMKILDDGGEEPVEALKKLSALSLVEKREFGLKDAWDFVGDRSEYREKWHKVWTENKLDVLLCAGSRATATPHGSYGVPWYTLLWNLLDCPASVIPYLKADKAVDNQELEGYDKEAAHGAPCSVQVVGWKYLDEEVLMATEVISEVLRRE